MTSVSTNYSTYFRLKDNQKYDFTKCGLCCNVLTGRKIKKVATKSGCKGFNIKGKFNSLTSIKPKLEKIPKAKCPF